MTRNNPPAWPDIEIEQANDWTILNPNTGTIHNKIGEMPEGAVCFHGRTTKDGTRLACVYLVRPELTTPDLPAQAVAEREIRASFDAAQPEAA